MFCLEEREDSSPSVQRRKRPLSMVLEENHEDPPTSGEEIKPKKVSRLRSSQEIPGISRDSNQDSTDMGKRSRRVGISYGEPPPILSSPQNETPPSLILTPRYQQRLLTPSPPRRKISENTIKLRRDLSETSEGTDSEAEGDLVVSRLKDTATKLNLNTRRESYLTWHAKYADEKRSLPEPKAVTAGTDGKLTKERKEKIDNDLKWIREQLVGLRHQDRSLARQLLGIRQELSSMRLAVSYEEHRELLEEAQDEMEDFRELSRFDDCPIDVLSSSPLKHIGVTKMNLSSRRFSTC
ncbi:hypothetical protein ACOMHN_039367 [Nucella lapillus]